MLVTGAAGGVGSVAVAVLAQARLRGGGGHRPARRPTTTCAGSAQPASCRATELAEPSTRGLESETWAGCVDAVGGPMLQRVTKQLKYRCSAAAVGNAGGVDVPLSIIPFLLRGVNLLGIDSVMQPYDNRRRAWARLVRDLDLGKLDAMVRPATLADLPALGAAILKGEVRGRVVVDVNA